MSSKNKESTGIHFDSRTRSVMTSLPHGNHESVKEKVVAVREVVPNRSNHEITLVLQYYEYNISETIAAFMEDGGASALKCWNYNGTKPVKKKKNKKTKQSTALAASSQLNSIKERGDEVLNRENQVISAYSKEDVNDDHLNDVPIIPEETKSEDYNSSTSKVDVTTSLESMAAKPASSVENSRQNSVSEFSESVKNVGGKKSLEKAAKELSRHSLSLLRTRILLEEEMEKSHKRLTSSFRELHQLLNEKESELMNELAVVRRQAGDLLQMRQELADNLKMGIERGDGMSTSELNELRIDIKHFVSERKLDDDLGRAIRFIRDHDKLVKEIKAYGEVTPAENRYTLRRLSVSSLSSLTQSETSNSVTAAPPVVTPIGNTVSDASITLSSPSLSAGELAELHQKLKDSCRLQGLPVGAVSSREHSNGRSQSPLPATKYGQQNDANDPIKRRVGGNFRSDSRQASRGRGGSSRGRGSVRFSTNNTNGFSGPAGPELNGFVRN